MDTIVTGDRGTTMCSNELEIIMISHAKQPLFIIHMGYTHTVLEQCTQRTPIHLEIIVLLKSLRNTVRSFKEVGWTNL